MTSYNIKIGKLLRENVTFGALLICASVVQAGELTFREHFISYNDPEPSWASRLTYLADIDDDGDIDFIAASRLGGGPVRWFENSGGSSPTFTSHLIDTHPDCRAVFAADLDGDGDIDLMSASALIGAQEVRWYENDGAPNPGFTKRVIPTTAIDYFSLHADKIDGDLDIDIITGAGPTGPSSRQVAWHTNIGGRPPAFTERELSRNTDWPHTLASADLDDDDDVDIVSGSLAYGTGGSVVWYENDGKAAPAFTQRIISSYGSQTAVVSVDTADVNGDGDVDVLAAIGEPTKGRVVWYENEGGMLPGFAERVIATINLGNYPFVFPADLDGDGDVDVLASRRIDNFTRGQFVWFENEGGSPVVFKEHEIATTPPNVVSVNTIYAVDLDGDKDLDVFAREDNELGSGGRILWYENLGESTPVCWPVNGHCYQNIGAAQITWNEAKMAAENSTFRGMQGHLATITSQAEQDFVNTLKPPPEQDPPFGGTRGWIGGFQTADGEPFQWVTGETFDYTNWRVGEPRGDTGNNFVEFNWELLDWNDTANLDPAIDGYLVEYSTTGPLIRYPGDINNDNIQDVAAIIPDTGTLKAVIRDLTGALVNQFTIDSITRVADVEVMGDIDNNGAPELVVLGQGSVIAEVRDSLSGDLQNTVSFNLNNTPIDLEIVPDQDGNGIPELAVLGDNPVQVETRDALTGNMVNTVSYTDNMTPRDLLVLPDLNGKGGPEMGVLGEHDNPDKNDRVEIRDLLTGRWVRNLTYGKLNVSQAQVVSDLNNNGTPEVAVLRTTNGRVNVLIRDATNNAFVRGYGFDPNYAPGKLLVVPDVNGNNASEIAVFGKNPTNQTQKAQVKDGKSKKTVRNVFFNKAFDPADLVVISDMNGNGASEIGMLGTRIDGNATKLFIKDSKSGALVGTVNF